MGRSSRLLILICVVMTTPALGQSRGGMVRVPTNLGGRMALHAAIPPVRAPAARAMRLTSGRPGFMGRRNGFGFYGVGLGLSLASDLATPQVVARENAADPEVIPGVSPPPCIRPQIIKIGLGLRHVARTRVIYGTPLVCSP